MEQINTRIRTLRKNKNMTQEELAEVLCVSAQAVSKWETGVSVPDIALLPIIARHFGITMDELFGYRLNALNYKERFIRFMADNGVLKFGKFELQSGRSSPYMIDTRNYRSASQLAKLGAFYAECLREHNVETNLLAGNGTKEIPLVIATGMTLFNRYGMDIDYHIDRSIEKAPNTHDKITLVKDTLTSGRSLKAGLQNTKNGTVSSVIVSVDRMERGAHPTKTARNEIENDYGVKIHAIVTLDDIILAIEDGVIGGAEYLAAIKQYQTQYGGN